MPTRAPTIIVAAFILGGTFVLGAGAAFAHAFLDHADPPVGRTLSAAPSAVRLWFTENVEPAFSHVQVLNAGGRRVDRNDSHVDPHDPSELVVSLKPLPPGTYQVVWRVVSVDTHVTQGRHTFKVTGP